MKRWLARGVAALTVAALVAAGVAYAALTAWGRDLPDVGQLERWDPPRATRIVSSDGFLLAELATERRTPVDAREIPRHVAQAIVAGEDARFFHHRGVDPVGIARAAWANLRAGRIVQGGSTLTQQVAKTLVGSERTLRRKVREVLVAQAIERRFDKRSILWLYLNLVYFGRGAYGIDQAARAYFGQPVSRVTLSEAAFLAGLPQRPSLLSSDPDGAEARRRRVLRRMEAAGWIDEATRAATEAERPRLVGPPSAGGGRAPFAVEAIRQRLVEAYGNRRVLTGGLQVTASVDLGATMLAERALNRAAQALDRRQGSRGPLATGVRSAASRARYISAFEAAYGHRRPGVGATAEALVTEVAPRRAAVALGRHEGSLPLEGARWQKAWDSSAESNEGALDDLTEALSVGDVVLVRVVGVDPVVVHPVPVPGVEGALVAIDPVSGAAEAWVGGRDGDASEFDRIVQACRQPGSVFKPLVYSAAISRGISAAAMLTDAPWRGDYQGDGLYYRPGNFDGEYRGAVLLATALAQSRNAPSIELLRRVGTHETADWARQLGVDSPLDPVDGLVLGGSCVKTIEMVKAFSVFAAGGRRAEPHLVTRITLPDGSVPVDRRSAWDRDLEATEALDRALAAARAPAAPPVMDRDKAFVMSDLLRGVVRRGTARLARSWSWPAAGKTGTSDKYDAWFVGYTGRSLAAVWIGPDRNERPLGKGETGGRVALPAWLDYMRATHAPFEVFDPWADPPPTVVRVAVDPRTGLRAPPGSRSLTLPFLAGTQPRRWSDPSAATGQGAGGRTSLTF